MNSLQTTKSILFPELLSTVNISLLAFRNDLKIFVKTYRRAGVNSSKNQAGSKQNSRCHVRTIALNILDAL